MLNKYSYVSKDSLLENYSYRIFDYYFIPFSIGKFYKSPLRQDKIPSFNIYKSNKNKNVLLYKDFGGTKGNAIDFVMNLKNISFYSALDLIVKELKLPYKVKNRTNNIQVNKKEYCNEEEEEKKKYLLRPTLYKLNRKPIYNQTDLKYWIRDLKVPTIKYLIKHNVYSAKELHIGKAFIWLATTESPIYIFYEKYLDSWFKKAYRPFGEIGEKWRSDLPDASNIIHGLHLLKGNSDDLIITKAVKDNIVLDVLGFETISTQGEDMPFNINLMSVLKKHYKNIFVLYDNDFSKEENTGRILSNKFAQEHNINQIIIPSEYPYSDVSELIYKFDRNTLKHLINKWKN